jgi:hypothetical protein
LWHWDGRFHPVPKGWLFPSTNVKDTWRLWHFGNPASKVRPLRFLKKMDLANPAQTVLWSKASGVIKAISDSMVEMKLVDTLEAVDELNEADSLTKFDKGIVNLLEKLRPGCTTKERSRIMELSVFRLYTLIPHRSRKRSRAEMNAAENVSNDEEEKCAD